jgi:threonine/homoserine/homoserine lactone efflux protein
MAMDPTAAILAGVAAGLAIAVQVGPVSLLLIEAAVVDGPRAGAAAGMGVATADLAFAAVAATAGGAAGAALSSHQAEIRLVAALVLAAIAIRGLLALSTGVRERGRAAPDAATGTATVRGHYARFLAITAANPLTVASFAAVAAALALDGPAAAIAFAGGVGAASGAWHLALATAAGHSGRWMTPRVRRVLAIGGRLAVLAIACHLALGG